MERARGPRRIRFLLAAGIALLATAAAWSGQRAIPSELDPKSFARIIEAMSEPEGEFDTDNLISNEKSYLHVLPQLETAGAGDGIYIGVGPDQNFSYIARLRPAVAFLIDIRRDNLLLHLLFKAIIAESASRVEYLALLTGRPVPEDVAQWRSAAVGEIADYIDAAEPRDVAALQRRLRAVMERFGVPLSAADFATISRFHNRFIEEGLSLRFHSHGRPPQRYYPTYRELLTETDRQGRPRNFLASEEDFQFVRSLQQRNLVIPVVGDLAGPRAMAAIGQWMREHNALLAAIYVSNVENYLFRDGVFGRYLQNLKRLPYSDRSLVIRSVFGRIARSLAAPGYASISTTQNFGELLGDFSNQEYRSYSDLLSRCRCLASSGP